MIPTSEEVRDLLAGRGEPMEFEVLSQSSLFVEGVQKALYFVSHIDMGLLIEDVSKYTFNIP